MLVDSLGRPIERRRRIGFVLTGEAYVLARPGALTEDAIASAWTKPDEEEDEVCGNGNPKE